jgi:hypothetical protein
MTEVAISPIQAKIDQFHELGVPCSIGWIDGTGFSVRLLRENGDVIAQTSFSTEEACIEWLIAKSRKYYPHVKLS